MRFTDRTGRPGPRHWENGKFPQAKADHPVVGVCWYEALAYARWVGKRLPTAADGRRPGAGPSSSRAASATAIPGATSSTRSRANLSPSGRAGPSPSTRFPEGTTPNGIYQMSGNVWEWLADPLESIPCESPASLRSLDAPAPDQRRRLRYLFPGGSHLPLTSPAKPELDRRDEYRIPLLCLGRPAPTRSLNGSDSPHR